ncbi:MAG: Rieske 2Fe-2S domain-containing protein [Nannocystaceae bacterium]
MLVAPASTVKPAHPLTPYPRGWYLIAHSDEVEPGEVRPLHLFGRDLAVFRSATGRAHVVDAHCPHLGAHLGHGGKVVGECIRCPFHGWEFAAESGDCVRIANGDAPPPRARLGRWHVTEVNEMILAWFHEAGEAPEWQVPELPAFAEPGWSRWSPTSWDLKARIQDLAENDADVSHSPVMHSLTDALPTIAMDAEGPRCTWTIEMAMKPSALGLPKVPLLGALDRVLPRLPSRVEVLRWGLCVGWIRQWTELPGGLKFASQTLATTTPIDDTRVRLTFRHRVRALPIPGLTALMRRKYARLFDDVAREDVVIWEHKIYRMRPLATRTDWAILRFRRWSRQFYDPAHWDAAMGREGAEYQD